MRWLLGPLFYNSFYGGTRASGNFAWRGVFSNRQMKKDIIDRADIALLVQAFYEQVRMNQQIGYIFNDVAKVDWEHHLPIMFDFWESVLFHTGTYSRNPITVHKQLNTLTPLKREHFAEWIRLWHGAVDGLFEGPNAEKIKQRASSIATVMQVSILDGGISRPRMS